MVSEIQFQSQSMYDVIASSFFLKRSCRLPGIGILEMVRTPAEYDFSNQQIKAPQQKILFIPSSFADHSFNEFSAISQLLKDRLNNDGRVDISGLGAFTKDSSGLVQFTPAEIGADFFQPVAAVRVIHKDAEHAILVGDKETTNVEMTEFFAEDTAVANNKWWVWAIVLGTAAIAVIAYYIYQHGLNDLSNQPVY